MATQSGGGTLTIAEQRDGVFRNTTTMTVAPGDTLSVGRQASLLIADDPPDPAVSRRAVEVRREVDAWLVSTHNRNGIVIHPWALPGWPARTIERLTDTRVALRVNGSAGRLHWVLLETEAPPPAVGNDPGPTERGPHVRPLTLAQHEVLETMFDQLLRWPPTVPAEPRQIKQVARRLKISESAVQARLAEIRAKAESLGLSRRVPLSDPEYVHVLVRAGYLTPERG